MKKNYVLFFSLFCSLQFFAQSYVIPPDMVTSFIKTNAANVKYSDAIIKSQVDADNFYEISLTYGNETGVFKLKPLTYPYFESKFKTVFSEVIQKVKTKDDTAFLEVNETLDASVNNKIAVLFTQIVTYFNTEEEQPEVATIYLKEDIPVYYNTENESIGNLTEVMVEISFYGGFIEKMQVNGRIEQKPVSFNNKYSIGISSTKNISQLANNILYSTDKFDVSTFSGVNAAVSEPQTIKTDKKSLMIRVDDVIRYVKKVDVNANDVSPVPQLLILDKDQKETKLYREKTSKLFEAVVYSDLLGIFDEENPNGIIQTEINKQFNITSRRFDVFGAFIEAAGFFNYFNAQFQFSKIEKNNKFLLPQSYDVLDAGGNTVETINYYSPISLYQYRNYAAGGQLNLLFLENQNAKINVLLDGGFLFGRSGIKATEEEEEGRFINNLEIPIELKFLVLPEKRFSFHVSDRLSWFESFDNAITLRSVENEKLVSKNRWLNTLNVGFNLDVSSNGKLFLRYKLIHELDAINTNFSQLQFGYSFYLLQKNGARKNNI